MEKFKYGTKETVATLLGIAFFVLAEWGQMNLARGGIIPDWTYAWVQLRVLVIAIVSVFFGPICGLFSGLGGDLIVNILFESSISYPEVVILGIYGLFMGLYYGRYHFPKEFSFRDFLDYNAIQIFAGIFCGLFVLPLMLFFIEDIPIYSGVTIGAKSTLGNSILVGVVVSVIMAVYGGISKKRSKGRTS